MGLVELAENRQQVVGNHLVADHLARMGLSVVVPVEQAQIAQVAPLDMRILMIGLALHELPHGVVDLLGRKTIIARLGVTACQQKEAGR